MGGRGSSSSTGGGASASDKKNPLAVDTKKFEGLNAYQQTNKYVTMDRVDKNETKAVIKVADDNLIATKYGYAMIIDETHVVFVKDWQVSRNYYGNEVLLNKDYYKVKEWGNHADRGFIGTDTTYNSFNGIVKLAKEQQAAGNKVKWEQHKPLSDKAIWAMKNSRVHYV